MLNIKMLLQVKTLTQNGGMRLEVVGIDVDVSIAGVYQTNFKLSLLPAFSGGLYARFATVGQTTIKEIKICLLFIFIKIKLFCHERVV